MAKLLLWSAAILLSFVAAPAAAQQSTSDIIGRVADQHGGVLPGVTIVVTNEQTVSPRSFLRRAKTASPEPTRADSLDPRSV
jgi:hypothetical protein